MRIAIAGQTYLPGNNGQAIFTIHLAEGLARVGHEVHMIAPSNSPRYQYENINGVHVHRLRSIYFRSVHPEAYFALLPVGQIRRIFKEHRPDIVHIQDHYFLCIDVTRVALGMKIPVLGTNHFLPENLLPYLNPLPLPRQTKISILWDLMLMTYNRLNHVTTPTETAVRILQKTKIRVPVSAVSNGVDTHHFHPPAPDLDRVSACSVFGLDPNKILFLFVGRQDREKRIDLLLRGLALLRDQGRTDIHLAIAGQGAAGGELRGLAHSLGLEKQVRFLGYVPNEKLPLLYQTVHVFAMPSPEELQSLVTLEAMASGRPVLAANARALPELVKHGVNGYLFDSNTSPAGRAVADGMAYLADHRADWEAMGRVSRERAVTHSLENSIRKYSELYRCLVEETCPMKARG